MRLRKLFFLFALIAIQIACTLPLVIDEPATKAPVPTTVPTQVIPSPIPDFTEPLPTDKPPTELPPPPVTETPQPAPESETTPQPTPTQLPPTPPPTPTEVTPLFIMQPGSPVALPNFTQPQLGCGWMGVGGQIFNRDGNPVPSLIVQAGGTLAGVQIDLLTVSGGATAFGEGGFEFNLSQRPLGSEGELYIQLFDLSGEQLSDRIYFDTFNSCDRNLILLNFLELPMDPFRIYLPASVNKAP